MDYVCFFAQFKVELARADVAWAAVRRDARGFTQTRVSRHSPARCPSLGIPRFDV